VTDHRLQEINFGRWEQKPWSSIPEAELNPWMNDFVNMSIPGGESYRQLYQRSVAFFTSVVKTKQNAVVTTHSGVIRSILSYCSGVELENSFNAFELSFGCIARLDVTGNRILFPAVIR
jgi:alpha-ribazole phosphatase